MNTSVQQETNKHLYVYILYAHTYLQNLFVKEQKSQSKPTTVLKTQATSCTDLAKMMRMVDSKLWSLWSKSLCTLSSNCRQMNMGSDGLIRSEKNLQIFLNTAQFQVKKKGGDVYTERRPVAFPFEECVMISALCVCQTNLLTLTLGVALCLGFGEQ